MNSHSGFTLLETLVALSILALALLALLKASMQQINTQHHLRQKTLAQWVAANQLTRLRLSAVSPTLEPLTGQSDMAQQTWYWQAVTQPTANRHIKQITIQTGLPDHVPLAHLTGFIALSSE